MSTISATEIVYSNPAGGSLFSTVLYCPLHTETFRLADRPPSGSYKNRRSVIIEDSNKRELSVMSEGIRKDEEEQNEEKTHEKNKE
jgi:hypothetical protein